MAQDDSPTRHHNSVGVKGTSVAPVVPRMGNLSVPLANYKSITEWNPKVSDIVIWHGWIRRWYGVVSATHGDSVIIIRDGLPCLLFTMTPDQYKRNSIEISVHKIRNSGGGEFHTLQDGVWYI